MHLDPWYDVPPEENEDKEDEDMAREEKEDDIVSRHVAKVRGGVEL